MTLREIAAAWVSRLKPGESIEIDLRIASDNCGQHLAGFMGPAWSPAEIIMENIVGSAYEFTYRQNDVANTVTFHRLEKPLTDGVTYFSPDRIERAKAYGWERGPDGIYRMVTA